MKESQGSGDGWAAPRAGASAPASLSFLACRAGDTPAGETASRGAECGCGAVSGARTEEFNQSSEPGTAGSGRVSDRGPSAAPCCGDQGLSRLGESSRQTRAASVSLCISGGREKPSTPGKAGAPLPQGPPIPLPLTPPPGRVGGQLSPPCSHVLQAQPSRFLGGHTGSEMEREGLNDTHARPRGPTGQTCQVKASRAALPGRLQGRPFLPLAAPGIPAYGCRAPSLPPLSWALPSVSSVSYKDPLGLGPSCSMSSSSPALTKRDPDSKEGPFLGGLGSRSPPGAAWTPARLPEEGATLN